MNAPTIGASIGAITAIACTTARMVLRVRRSKQSLIIAVEIATMQPAPSACSTRAMMSSQMLVASAQAALKIV